MYEAIWPNTRFICTILADQRISVPQQICCKDEKAASVVAKICAASRLAASGYYR
jgi:hypothetical protein